MTEPLKPTPFFGDRYEHWRDEYEERAAIHEFDGGLSRADAEHRAYAHVMKARRREIQGNE